MTIAVDWDVKQKNKRTNMYLYCICSYEDDEIADS